MVALLLFGFVVLQRGTDASAESSTAAIAIVVVLGIAAAVGSRFLERPLDCADEIALVRSYSTRFFVRIGGGEVAALAGFVAAMALKSPVVYLAGLAVTFVAWWRAAPTARHLAGDQESLNREGCGRSLLAALTATR